MPLVRDLPFWAVVSEWLREQDAKPYIAWIAQLDPHDLGGRLAQLVSPLRLVADYIMAHYISRLSAAALAEDRGFVAFEIRETLKPR